MEILLILFGIAFILLGIGTSEVTKALSRCCKSFNNEARLACTVGAAMFWLVGGPALVTGCALLFAP